MLEERVTLLSVQDENGRWIAKVSFRGAHHTLSFKPGDDDQLRELSPSPFSLTIEGHEVCRLAERVRRGEALALPCSIEPSIHGPRLPSVRRDGWRPCLGLASAWLDAVECTHENRYTAHLRLDDERDTYAMEILPDGVVREIRSPQNDNFHDYVYDLLNLLMRMHGGERFSLPFKLRPRWPTPEPPSALP